MPNEVLARRASVAASITKCLNTAHRAPCWCWHRSTREFLTVSSSRTPRCKPRAPPPPRTDWIARRHARRARMFSRCAKMNHNDRGVITLPLTPVLPAGGRTGQHEVGAPAHAPAAGLRALISATSTIRSTHAQAESLPAGNPRLRHGYYRSARSRAAAPHPAGQHRNRAIAR